MMKKILVSGGEGFFAKKLIKYNTQYELYAAPKSELDVTNLSSIETVLDEFSPDIFIHSGGFTRPMVLHKTFPDKSIKINIIGTSNVVVECMKRNIKLVYISTDYVYPRQLGMYSEDSGVYPVNKYAWSKLGGECAVMLYDNSLILRTAMCQNPFPHKEALVDVEKSVISQDEAAKILFDLLDNTGIINVGGPPKSMYEFIKKTNPNIKKIYLNDIKDVEMSFATMDCSRMQNILTGENDDEF
jgi:dTDP-4-dehydrorhamnose reductase